MGQLAGGLAVGGLIASGCGNKNDSAPPQTSTGMISGGARTGVGGTSGKGGRSAGGEGSGLGGENSGGLGDIGGAGGAGTVSPLAPDVRVTSPDSESDPNGRGVIVDDQVDVLCTATPSTVKGATSDLAPTVVLELLDAHGDTVDNAPGIPTDNDDEYRATFITTKVADNGRIGFRCSAGNQNDPALSSSDTAVAFIDHGPIIEFSDAIKEGDHIPLHKALEVTFSVKESPVAKNDKGAAIDNVVLTVLGKKFSTEEKDGEYTASVQLDDQTLFSVSPDGFLPMIVKASDSRKPTAALRTEQRDADVDGTGPTIVIQSPANEDVRGGKVPLIFKATDDQSGVDPATILVRLNGDEYRYSDTDKNWGVADDGNTYTFTFDTTQIVGSQVQATVDVTASDKVGNLSQKAAIVIYLDNKPPIVDLDPPVIREYDKGSKDCSGAFDPVGTDAANDLQTVYQLKKFRSLVWDLTNGGMGQTIYYFSGPDLSSVEIRLQPHVEQGLLIDTNDDGICDDLKEKDTDTGNDLPFQPLHGVPPQGSAWYGPAETDALASEFPMPSGCLYGSATMPQALCPPTYSDDMFRVIPWDVDATIPAIFAVGSLEAQACTGTDWEIGPVVSEGWICVASRATDNVGNVGISRPLRLCFDDGKDPPPSCLDQMNDPPPDCTDGCTLPPKFDPDTLLVKP